MEVKTIRRFILPSAALLAILPLAGCSKKNNTGTTSNTTPPTAPATPPAMKPAVNTQHLNGMANHTAHKMGTMGHAAGNKMGAMGNHMAHQAGGMANHMGASTKSMSSTAAVKARGLLTKAIAYVKANKTSLAQKTFAEINKLKPKLPTSLVTRINQAEAMFKLKSGVNGIGLPK